MFNTKNKIKNLLNQKSEIKKQLDTINQTMDIVSHKNNKIKDIRSIDKVFSQFCKERHEEDKKRTKGKNFNELQEIYASTELFDLSLIPENDSYDMDEHQQLLYAKKTSLVGCVLPFQAIFVKISGNSGNCYIFAREYSPTKITGTLYTVISVTPKYVVQNDPFVLDTETGEITLLGDKVELFKDLDKAVNSDLADGIRSMTFHSMFCDISSTLETLNNLSKKKVYSKTETTEKIEYYRRKSKPTIKVSSRPIYYVLEPKDQDNERKIISKASNTCRIELNHSFRVRGHWRKINSNSYGKNRNGEYTIIGHTWVIDHVRGEGELVRRLRVVKQN